MPIDDGEKDRFEDLHRSILVINIIIYLKNWKTDCSRLVMKY